MNLWDEAEKITLLGVETYRFGCFVALGLVAAAAVIAFLSWAKRCKKGTAPLLTLCCMVLGGVCSRIGFCLMNQELGDSMPLGTWLQITGGGWSMIGLVGGAFLASLVTAALTRQKTAEMADITAVALPIFMVAERLGEGSIPDFDVSRALENDFLKGSFLAFTDLYDDAYLATYRLAAICMGILFAVLLADMIRGKKHGDTAALFLILYGAMTVILESLRYDRFLSITFVHLEQVLAAVVMLIGILLAGRGTRKKKLRVAAVIAMFLAAGIAVGLEFALDRTTWNRILIYGVYVVVMAIPAVMGILLRKQRA